MQGKKAISNQNFIAWLERKGFDRNIDLIETTDKGIIVSIEAHPKDVEIYKLLLE